MSKHEMLLLDSD